MYNLFITNETPSMGSYNYNIKVVIEKSNGSNSTTEYNTCKFESHNGQVIIFDNKGMLEILPISKTRIKFMRRR
jgi:hypothetical protein